MARQTPMQAYWIALAGFVSLSLSACAGHSNQTGYNGYSAPTAQSSAQFGGIHAFEGGHAGCGSACQAATVPQYTGSFTPAYTQPVPQYTAPRSPAPSYTNPPTHYGSGTTGVTTRQMDCPTGTIRQADGSCLHTSSTGFASGTCGTGRGSSCGSSRTFQTHTITTQQANCPTGTVKQPDGSCLQPASTGYRNQATTRRPTGTYSGYSTGGYGLHDYRPTRK